MGWEVRKLLRCLSRKDTIAWRLGGLAGWSGISELAKEGIVLVSHLL